MKFYYFCEHIKKAENATKIAKYSTFMRSGTKVKSPLAFYQRSRMPMRTTVSSMVPPAPTMPPQIQTGVAQQGMQTQISAAQGTASNITRQAPSTSAPPAIKPSLPNTAPPLNPKKTGMP